MFYALDFMFHVTHEKLFFSEVKIQTLFEMATKTMHKTAKQSSNKRCRETEVCDSLSTKKHSASKHQFVLKDGLIEKIKAKYVGSRAVSSDLVQAQFQVQISALKKTIKKQKRRLNEWMENPQDETGHIYLMSMEPLSYKNKTQVFPFESMLEHQSQFKISITGKSHPSTQTHQTNSAHKLIIAYQSEFKFRKYKECKELFKQKYSACGTAGGTEWFISDIFQAKKDIEQIIAATCGVSIALIENKNI